MRRGFALLAVLWFIAALTALVTAGLAVTRTGDFSTRNRIALIRERWAAEACAEIARAHWNGKATAQSGTESLGGADRCAWLLSDPLTGLNANLADSATLANAFAKAGSSVDSARYWVARILERRRAARIESLQALSELDSLPTQPFALLTLEGSGQVSSAAPSAVLAALPGLGSEAIAVIAHHIEMGRPIGSLDELDGLLSGSGRAELEAHYADLSGRLVFRPSIMLLTATGLVGADSTIPSRTIECLVSVQPGRLVITRRRVIL